MPQNASPALASDMVLAVDLDDTLLMSDMLYETLWQALSTRWANLVPIAKAAGQGRAPLKKVLDHLADMDVASLPYNPDVLERIAAWKAQGGQVALVSASDKTLVDKVAAHLGVFDMAHGSDGETNLKGATKSAFLRERFPDGFAYMGDARADLAIWPDAALAITVGADPDLRRAVEQIDVPHEHIGPIDSVAGHHARPLIKALRPHQWLKNLLIFLPVMLAHELSGGAIGLAILAFLAFSLTASSVYLLNDLLDLSSDRAHPRKSERPFAAGTLPLLWGTVLAPGLLLAGMILSALVGWAFLGVMVLYYALTTAYSFSLKRRLVIDICTLAGLYTIRIIAGGVATDTTLSVWLLAFSTFFFFSLAAVKRQAELVSNAATGAEKAAGRGYETSDLPFVANMAVSAGYVSVLVLALYINSDAVQQLYNVAAPLWGICFVLLYWLSRMVMITHRGSMHDDPVVFAITDRVSQLCAITILTLAFAATWG